MAEVQENERKEIEDMINGLVERAKKASEEYKIRPRTSR